MLIVWFLSIKSLPNLLFGVLCLPGDQSHPFAQPSINPLACCICWAGLLGRAVFPPWNEGPNFGSYIWITTNCGKFLKRWKYQTTSPAFWEICTQVKKQQLVLDMEEQTGSKLGKEYIKAVYCYPLYLTYMQSTSCEMPCCMKHKVESRLPGETSVTSDMQMTPSSWQKAKRN